MPPSNTIATTDPKQQQNGNGNPKEMMKLEPPTTTIVVPPDGGWGWVVSLIIVQYLKDFINWILSILFSFLNVFIQNWWK